MPTKDDGGPAFPTRGPLIPNSDGGFINMHEYGEHPQPGMTLRAYIATCKTSRYCGSRRTAYTTKQRSRISRSEDAAMLLQDWIAANRGGACKLALAALARRRLYVDAEDIVHDVVVRFGRRLVSEDGWRFARWAIRNCVADYLRHETLGLLGCGPRTRALGALVFGGSRARPKLDIYLACPTTPHTRTKNVKEQA